MNHKYSDMKKIDFLPLLLSLLVMGFFSSCSTTKYGAHFQPSKYQHKTYEKQEKVAENAHVLEESTEVAAEQLAERNGAEIQETEMVSPVASIKEVKITTEVPKAEALTERQEEVIREVEERLQNMSRQEKRDLRRQIRKLNLKEYTKDLPVYNSFEMEGLQQETQVNILALILALILPPLGVYVHQGEVNNKFWISLLLTVLFYVPGQIYSVLVVLGVV